MDVQSWLALARAGDAEAFERILAHHERSLYAIARVHTPSDDDALDACQEAALRAWRGIARFDGSEQQLRAWLTRIVINTAHDRGRLAARATVLGMRGHNAGDDVLERVLDPGSSPEELAAAGEVGDAVERAIAQLPADQRATIALARTGMPYDEIADVLGIATGTVKSRVARARLALRRMLCGAPAMEPFREFQRSEGEP